MGTLNKITTWLKNLLQDPSDGILGHSATEIEWLVDDYLARERERAIEQYEIRERERKRRSLEPFRKHRKRKG